MNWLGVMPAMITRFIEKLPADHVFLARHAAWLQSTATLAAVATLLSCSANRVFAQLAPSNATVLNAFYAAEWEYELEHNPEMATYVGDPRFNDRLGDYSAEEAALEAEHAAEQLKHLQALATVGLDEQQTMSREIMLRQLQSSIDSYRLKEWEMPVSQMNGFHLDLPAMYQSMPFHTVQDYRNYIARLHQVPRVFAQQTAVMQIGMRDHMMQPRYLLEKVVVETQEIASAAPDKSPFAIPVRKFPR